MSHVIRIRMAEPAAPDNALENINDVKGSFRSLLGSYTSDATVKDLQQQYENEDNRIENEIGAYLRTDGGGLDDSLNKFTQWTDDQYVKKTANEYEPVFETEWQFVEEFTDPEFTDRPAHYLATLYFDHREEKEQMLDDIHNNQFPSSKWYVVHTRSADNELGYGMHRDDKEYTFTDTDLALNPEVDIIDWTVRVSNIAYKINGDLYEYNTKRFHPDESSPGSTANDVIVGTTEGVEYRENGTVGDNEVKLTDIERTWITFKGEQEPRIYPEPAEQSGERTSWTLERSRGNVPEVFK